MNEVLFLFFFPLFFLLLLHSGALRAHKVRVKSATLVVHYYLKKNNDRRNSLRGFLPAG